VCRYRNSRGGEPLQPSPRQAQQPARQPVDARQLLGSYAELDLGQHVLAEMQLSQRGRLDEQSGYYRCLHKLQLS
jgi:hypothetical protein